MRTEAAVRWMGRSRVAAALVAAVVIVAPRGACAQAYHSYPGARPVTDYSPSLGAVAGFGDDLIRLVGFARFNVSPVSDLGIEALYENIDHPQDVHSTGFGGAGLDLKYQFIATGDRSPVDVSAQVASGFLARSHYLNVRAPLGAVASRDFALNDGRKIVPYGGVYVVIDYVDVESQSDTDVDVELRLGASAEIVRRGSVFAAFHAGAGTMFFLGFNAGL